MGSNKMLTIELIPKTCWFSSVRTMVKPKEWDMIRFISYDYANNKCEICGDNGLNQGYKHRVECHEVWEYDLDTLTQKLVNLVSLCPLCHQVKHIGRTIAIGKEKEAIKHLSKVNKWTLDEINKHLAESYEIHSIRSKYQWKLDISLLECDPFNLELKKVKHRIFEVKKYKKKRKRSKTKTAAKKAAVKKNKRPKKN
jgi:hypothetical protein